MWSIEVVFMICWREGKATAVEGLAVQGPVLEVRYSCSERVLKVVFVRREVGVWMVVLR